MKNFIKQLITFILVAGVLAGAYFVLDAKTDLIDKLFSREYEVTWVVEGESTTKKYVYGTIPEYSGTPIKAPTTTIEYVFDGWEPEVVAVSRTPATYTAKFKAQTRKYSVNINSNYSAGAEYVGTGKIYEYQENATVSLSTNFGYTFLGWFNGSGSGATLVSSSTTLSLGQITEDITLYPKFETTTYTINYNDPKSATNLNKTTLDATDETYTFKALSKTGYNFEGWFKESTFINKIESLTLNSDNTILAVARLNSNTINLYAKWSIINYSISYNLNGGSVSTPNPLTYTVEDLEGASTITLNNPSKTGCEFLGWAGTGLSARTKTVTLKNGDYGDRTYTAFYDDERAINLVVDGMELTGDMIIARQGVSVSAPEINSSDYGMGGYTIDGWYTDSACTNKYTFTVGPESDITLYGKWNYFIREGFIPYFSKFNSRLNGTRITINSFEELVSWVEFVEFNYITTSYSFRIGYTPSGGRTKQEEVKRAIEESFYAINGGYSYSSETFYLTTANKNTEAKNYVSVPAGKNYYQQTYALSITPSSPRSEDYDSFNRDKVLKTLNVETSNQLVYALEMGLKPVCKEGSVAETIYCEAKNILKEICDDSMTDINKLRAIYEWLILNVTYDYEAASNEAISVNNWYLYDSWFAEGVFLNHKAVCDGFSKAFLILAQIENIPTIRIAGDGHAWNKVYLDGKWFGIDATHGNLNVNGSLEVVNYAQFLFTDSFKTNRGYTGENHNEYLANTTYCYYETADYSVTIFHTSHNFDLLIDSQDELVYAIKYAMKNYNEKEVDGASYYTLDFAFSYVCDYESAISSALSSAGYTKGSYIPINLGYNKSTGEKGTDSCNHVAYCLALVA